MLLLDFHLSVSRIVHFAQQVWVDPSNDIVCAESAQCLPSTGYLKHACLSNLFMALSSDLDRCYMRNKKKLCSLRRTPVEKIDMRDHGTRVTVQNNFTCNHV